MTLASGKVVALATDVPDPRKIGAVDERPEGGWRRLSGMTLSMNLLRGAAVKTGATARAADVIDVTFLLCDAVKSFMK